MCNVACGLGLRAIRKALCGQVMGDANPAAARVRVCSACDGDYEDPERTAWIDDEDEGADESGGDRAQQSVAPERFPVREE